MYKRDMPLIRDHMLSSPEGLIDAVTFVLLTIQQQFKCVRNAMRRVKAEGRDSAVLFGFKRAGFDYVTEHAEVLHAALTKACEVGDVVGAIDVFSNVPGLGVVKAAFVCQLAGLEVGCLDVHNLTRFEINGQAFKFTPKTKRATRLSKIKYYVEVCSNLGGSEYLWDSWCNHVAGNRSNKTLVDGDAVSRFHVDCFEL